MLSSEFKEHLKQNGLDPHVIDLINYYAIEIALLSFNEFLRTECDMNYSLDELTNLQDLSFGYNQLTSVPAEICHLPNLQYLSLDNNQLTSVPAEIGHLTNLQVLSLYDNELTSLPAEICNLTNLQKLFLEYNQLTSLPAKIEHQSKQRGTRIYF